MGCLINRNSLQTVALVLVAFLIRLAAGQYFAHLGYPAFFEYHDIANNLIAGNGYVYHHLGTDYQAFVLPAYPLLIAFFLKFLGGNAMLTIFQCLISALACWQVKSLGQRFFKLSEGWALLAGIVVALHPGLIFYATRFHPLTMDLFVYLWALCAWSSLILNLDSKKAFVNAIVSTGLVLLSRSTLIGFLGLVPIFMLIKHKDNALLAIKRMATVFALALLIISPWLIRNAQVFDGLVYQTTSAEVFWRGNNAHASGSALYPDGKIVRYTADPELMAKVWAQPETTQQKLFLKAGLDYIKEHPAQAAWLFAKKWKSFWWFSDQTGVRYSGKFKTLYKLFYVPLLSLGIIGLIVAFKVLGIHWWLFVSYMGTISIIQSLCYVEGRHRWTVEPVLVLFAIFAMMSLWTTIKERA